MIHNIPLITSVVCLLCHWVPAGNAHLLCPPIDEAISEGYTCLAECWGDSYCQSDSGSDNTLCCATSTCGQQCLPAFNTPYHQPVLKCPELVPDTIDACYEECGGEMGECSGLDELCCYNGCGHSCTTGVRVTPACQANLDSRNGTHLIGAYVPQCDETGDFTPVQCHGSTGYCWCVRPDTGEPVGRTPVRFSQPECNTCFYKGEIHYPRETFADDCNTCDCWEDGSVSCTEMGCNVHVQDTFTSPFQSCPVLENGTVGICSEECGSDSDCNSDQRCCSNGCGHTCMDTIPIPYIAPPRECPDDYEDVICDIQECTDSCEDPDKLCCQNSCGSSICVKGELPPFPCTKTVNSLTGGALLGQYIPRCDVEDGTFHSLQCSSHYCWCVDEQSGKPTSDMREVGDIGDLDCSNVCEYNGKIYQHGEHTDNCGLCTCLDGGVACAESTEPCSTHCLHRGLYHIAGDVFPEGDGCNTCDCLEDGSVSCTEIGCNVHVQDTFTSPFQSCPVLEDGTVGICSEECGSDSDCNSDQRCCSNGCGHTCMDTIPIPYIAPPRECPDDYEDVICDIQECTDSCEDPDKLCCQNSCGSSVCVKGELPPFPCTKTVNGLMGGALLGQYIPRCDVEDGTFHSLQCSSHYCWCVDEQSGKPTSDMREVGDIGDLDCSSCYLEGTTFNHGNIVETYGQCAKSTCLGGEVVWTEDCDTCEYNGKIYQHGEHTDNCGLCTCLDGGVACAESTEPCSTHCLHRGLYHIAGDVFPEGDGCNTCFCSNSYEITCTKVECEEEEEDSDDLAWWHTFLIGAGTLIAILAVVAIALLVVTVLMIRSGQFSHKRLNDTSSEILSFESDTQILFKNGPPDGESVELKVPIDGDDNKDPVET